MKYEFTPAVNRSLLQAVRHIGGTAGDGDLGPALLLALLAQAECRAALVLHEFGIGPEEIRARWPALVDFSEDPDLGAVAESPDGGFPARQPEDFPEIRSMIAAVCSRLPNLPRPLSIATEHVLMGLADGDNETGRWLREQGLEADRLEAEIDNRYGYQQETADSASETPLGAAIPRSDPRRADPADVAQATSAGDDRPATESLGGGRRASLENVRRATEETHLLRVFDAAANRAREGLRVIEDYVRFVLDDAHLQGLLKQLRHGLVAALEPAGAIERLAARETEHDVGTALTLASEARRLDLDGLLAANFARLEEALRSLEEYGKLLPSLDPHGIERLRYRTYSLERAVLLTAEACRRLRDARLYVLLDGRDSVAELERMARDLIEAGVDVIQLRDKGLDDRELVVRARALRRCTANAQTLLIVNDRPDIAAIAGADGVHVGQEELTVKDARAVIGPEALVGVSTHSIEQARQAVVDGASYLGVGPTFPSGTKSFASFPGLELVGQVAREIRLPAFAIGGIGIENLPHVLEAGGERVAVGGAITGARDPAQVARAMARILAGRRQDD
jgi:thiamine-phosphate pyrophosphorylase